MRRLWATTNFVVAHATLANLAVVTFFVWVYPNVLVFQITTTLAWSLIAVQVLASHMLKRNDQR